MIQTEVALTNTCAQKRGSIGSVHSAQPDHIWGIGFLSGHRPNKACQVGVNRKGLET